MFLINSCSLLFEYKPWFPEPETKEMKLKRRDEQKRSKEAMEIYRKYKFMVELNKPNDNLEKEEVDI